MGLIHPPDISPQDWYDALVFMTIFICFVDLYRAGSYLRMCSFRLVSSRNFMPTCDLKSCPRLVLQGAEADLYFGVPAYHFNKLMPVRIAYFASRLIPTFIVADIYFFYLNSFIPIVTVQSMLC